jgi:ELWxxDGT repeat protein
MFMGFLYQSAATTFVFIFSHTKNTRMQKALHSFSFALLLGMAAHAQVTRINANQSLEMIGALNQTKTLFHSAKDGTMWVSEGTEASTIQLNPYISTGGQGALLNGNYIFSGTTPVHGTDLFLTDGTPDGTILLKDIQPNAASSFPDDFTVHNGWVYFTAEKFGEGRELWRTNGTPEGTTLVKDINPGNAHSNTAGSYEITPLGNLLIFSAKGDAGGTELWKTDGTAAGTVRIKDINPGAPESKPSFLWPIGNMLLFTAQTVDNGREVWRTDGTEAGTYMLRDIFAGPWGSTEIEIFPGFSIPVLSGFHIFNQKAYFIAMDGVNNAVLYVTDGTTANTTPVKTLVGPAGMPNVLLINAINLPGKFFFTLSDITGRSELWQSDGTPAGTSVFKSFHYSEEHPMPILFKNYSETNGPDLLYQGNTFFFSAATAAEGNELWKSDGTTGGTVMVKNIGPGAASGITEIFSYLYTTAGLYFAASNGTIGVELWKTDATTEGTLLVQDIRTGALPSNPQLMLLNNGKVFFGANDGEVPFDTDLFVLNGSFTPLPAELASFSVVKTGADVRLDWETITEANTSHFTIERSSDATTFNAIGTELAAGTSHSLRKYQFTDPKVVFPPSGKLYYRLVTYDKDGSKQYSKVVSLSGKAGSWNARLLSNTPGSEVSLQLEGLKTTAVVRVTDISGKVLMTRNYDARQWQINLPVQSLAKGIYVVTVYHEGEVKTLRFVK